MSLKNFSTVIINNNVDKYKSWFIRTLRKMNSLTTFYAGFLVCCVYVPIVCCVSDGSRRLTYEEIYNSTLYVQLQEPKTERPHNVNYNFNYTNNKDTKDKNIEEHRFRDKYELSSKEQLLVGFAHDPFRLSIPEADYLNGVREIDPKQYSNKGDRGKRGIIHLYNMLTCSTGCDPISYKGYGCYCGFLGSGRPTDGIDNCCKLHDECYENLYCPFYTVYFQPYYWKCYHGEPLCALENYKTRNQYVNGCAGKLCECDRRFAMCVRKYACPRGRPLCKSSPLRLLQNLLML